MADPIVIQCPQCSKKFKLPANPPAVFKCTGCSTAMDLSSFREPAAAPAAAPVGAAASAPAADEASTRERPSSRRSSRAGSRGTAKSAARARRGREEEEGDEEGDDRRGRHAGPPKTKNNALIWGSIAGAIVIVFVVILLMAKPKKDTPPATPPVAALPPTGPAAMGDGAMEAPMEEAPMEEPKPVIKKGTFHEIGHHPASSPDEQKHIDELVQKAVFENAGSDSVAAGKELVAIGMKAAPRLVNVFNTVKNDSNQGFDTDMGRVHASVADGLLRQIDGFQERTRHEMIKIKRNTEQKDAEKLALTWISWWDKDVWKDKPQKPWDERVDGNDEAMK